MPTDEGASEPAETDAPVEPSGVRQSVGVPALRRGADTLPHAGKTGVQRWGASIGQKLGLLICGLQVALVASLVAYFGREQRLELTEDLQSKSEIYAQWVSTQVRSAVAFDDRETAREVFDAVSSDPDLLAAVLYDQSGKALHVWGNPGAVSRSASGGVDARKVFDLPDRFLVVAPVQSLEGPRGTLTLEFTKAELVQSRKQFLRAGAWVSGLALLFGTGLALLIAHSFSRRLRAISVVAEKVAAGDLSQTGVTDRARDEIGSLARSFGAMLQQIKSLFAQAQERAAEEQMRLERLVQDRTLALEERNLDMRLVLDNVDQGFVTVDRRGQMTRERSAIVARWLGAPPESNSLWDYIEQISPGMRERLEMGWGEVVEGFLPLELTLDQMPKRFSKGSQHFSIDYRPILDATSTLERAVVVLSDITPTIERERAEEQQREALRVFSRVNDDRAGVLEFFAEARRLVTQITRNTPSDTRVTKRLIHTLKGNAAVFGVERLSRLCHAIEESMEESNSNIGETERRLLLDGWTEIYDQLSWLTGDASKSDLTISDADYSKLLHALESGQTTASVCALLHTWRLEATEVRLKRAARQATSLAERLGKAPLEVHIESNELRLDPHLWSDVWAEIPHLIRNAIDHGLEDADENPDGATVSTLRLRTFMEASNLVIEVEDSGRGVNWERVRELAKSRGLPSSSAADLERALFADGLTTKARVEETSGRGVGMAAVAAAVHARGGHIRVHSQGPRGTRVRLSLPATAAPSRSHPASDTAHEAKREIDTARPSAPREAT